MATDAPQPGPESDACSLTQTHLSQHRNNKEPGYQDGTTGELAQDLRDAWSDAQVEIDHLLEAPAGIRG
jgi:hypothetical protein